MPEITHAISVQQPWARSLLVTGPRRKPLENRYNLTAITRPPFPVEPGSWLGIHAGLAIHDLADWCLALCPEAGPPPLWERGALLGARRVVGWRHASEARQDPLLAPWVVSEAYIRAAVTDAQARRPGRAVARDGWCLVFDEAITFEPRPMRGALGRFALPAVIVV